MYKNFNKIWNYTKYQIFTKFITAVIFLPTFYLIRDLLVKSTGRIGLSSGDYIGFLLSPQGIIFILLSFLFFTIMIGIDLNAFILMSFLLEEKSYKLKILEIFKISLKSSVKFLNPMGALLILYIGLILPILELGLSFGPLAKFKIPNFVMSVIENNTVYYSIYIILIIILSIILFFGIFSVHFLLIFDKGTKNSFKFSCKLVKKYWKDFLKKFIIFNIKFSFTFFISVGLGILLFLPFSVIKMNKLFERTFVFFVLIVLASIISFFLFISIPLQVDKLTNLLKEYLRRENAELPDVKKNFELDRMKKSKYRLGFKLMLSLTLCIALIANFLTSFVLSLYFDEIFKEYKDIKIVAHRAGGDLAAENSLKGIELAIDRKVDFTEIDVQRTKDGYYVINHDKNFSRLSGVKKKSSEMTLEEIQKLTIKDEFDKKRDPQKVATLDEILDLSKGKIGVYIELKGATADEKMVDDVVKMVKDKKMEAEVAILSLDYKLVEYTESKYPEMKTGFLYFFSFGDDKKLVGDILIMEEKEATDKNIQELHSIGKEVVVWTVNTDESIDKFIKKDVDGIITDHVDKLQEAIKNREHKEDLDIILENIFEVLFGN